MKMQDVLARFGSREELAKWCGSTLRAVYQWQLDDEGRIVQRSVRCRVVMGLVLKTAAEARAKGVDLHESDAALLAEDLELVGARDEDIAEVSQ